MGDETLDAARAAARGTPGLRLLLLFGSRAEGRAHAGSDWDFGYLADPGVPIAALHGALIRATNNERVDLVDLAAAGAVLRYRADPPAGPSSRAAAGDAARFWLEAVDFWCDARAWRPAHERVLQRLGP